VTQNGGSEGADREPIGVPRVPLNAPRILDSGFRIPDSRFQISEFLGIPRKTCDFAEKAVSTNINVSRNPKMMYFQEKKHENRKS